MPLNKILALAKSLHLARRKKPYTLLIDSGLSLTTALLQVTRKTSWSDFHSSIKDYSQEERHSLLETHFDSLQLHEGYRYLAQLIAEGYFMTTLTTNVDCFLEETLREISNEYKHIDILIRGVQTDKEIADRLKYNYTASTQKTICLLRGDIKNCAYITLPKIMKFPSELKQVLTEYLFRDTLLIGFTTRSGVDILDCIPTNGGSLWYVMPKRLEDHLIRLPTNRYKNRVIKGAEADFNVFFHTLADTLHDLEKNISIPLAKDRQQELQAVEATNHVQQKGQKEMSKQEPMRDFFVSYNKRDLKWAEWIAWELEQAGFSVYFQAWDFLPSNNFGLLMQEATSHSKTTIAVLSEDYLNAPFTQAEWAAAFVQDPTGEQRRFLPIRVRPCRLTGVLKAVVHIDIVGLSEDTARQKLLMGATGTRKKPQSAPSFPGQEEGKIDESPTLPKDPLLPERPPYPSNIPPSSTAIKIFYVYGPEDQRLMKGIEAQLGLLRQKGLVSEWYSNKLTAGTEHAIEIEQNWQTADIILLLVSPSIFQPEPYAFVHRAIERHKAKKALVIPIITRPVDWQGAIFDTLTVLPDNKKAITNWSNRDEAFLNVTRGIRKAIDKLLIDS